MNIFLSELLEHWRAGGVTLPEVAQQLRMLSGDRIDYREELRQAASRGELDETVAQQLIFALASDGQSSAQPADQAAPTLLRTISAHAPESITLVPEGEAVSALRMGTGSTPNSHPKTEIARDRLKAAFGGTHAAGALSAEPLRLVPGSMVKQRFILKERIGHGGMGVVFSAIDRRKTEARDPNPLVAIKILDSELARYDKAWMALQREARKAQTLAHPNVVTVFDFDRDGDTAFMTMELLEGRSLEGFVRDARKLTPKPADVWPIIRGMAEGLAYAHRNGIVHSDLKPGNVFVTTNNVVKILDFGIARAVPAFAAKQKVQDTFDAVALGAYTATYATAEMMQGGEPHASDDVYGLALIAYELFTGAHPYNRLSAVEAQQQNLRPAPIKTLSRRQWRVLERSLRFERNERPQDAGEFLRELISLTRTQYITIATVAVLATTAVFLGYQNYIEAGPTISFSQLPADVQQQFTAYMRAGDDLWRFYQQDHNLLALQEAIDQYGHAFALHPRNRDATHALERAADAGLKDLAAQPAQQLALAKALAERSDYLAKYAPIRELVQ